MKNSTELVDGMREGLEQRRNTDSNLLPRKNITAQNRTVTDGGQLANQQVLSQNIKPVQHIAIDDSFSSDLTQILSRYNGEQQRRIMGFFDKMLENFSNQFTYLYGSEPDQEFAQFAADLELDELERIVQHLRERLLAGKEWPPALAMLKMLKDLPLNKEILEARHNILILKKPKSRVEKYIMQRKSSKIRSLSERHLAEEFKMLYISAFEEVQRDYDLVLEKQQEVSNVAVHSIEPTEIDKEIERRVREGITPNGKVGDMLNRINGLRNNKPELQAKDRLEKEQKAMAEMIKKNC
ncbi:hypothetical protein ACEO96_14925 [Vibrio anguillarum]|uniref:hypothetical protein n=1 Tax=Vibrio anguillarum TaxID=55601 RepID=UPI003593F602